MHTDTIDDLKAGGNKVLNRCPIKVCSLYSMKMDSRVGPIHFACDCVQSNACKAAIPKRNQILDARAIQVGPLYLASSSVCPVDVSSFLVHCDANRLCKTSHHLFK